MSKVRVICDEVARVSIGSSSLQGDFIGSNLYLTCSLYKYNYRRLSSLLKSHREYINMRSFAAIPSLTPVFIPSCIFHASGDTGVYGSNSLQIS